MGTLGPTALLVGAVAILALADSESGVRTWLGLRAEAREARSRVELAQARVEALRTEIAALDSDSLALERAIREDLELARPGETVVRFPRSGSSNARLR